MTSSVIGGISKVKRCSSLGQEADDGTGHPSGTHKLDIPLAASVMLPIRRMMPWTQSCSLCTNGRGPRSRRNAVSFGSLCKHERRTSFPGLRAGRLFTDPNPIGRQLGIGHELQLQKTDIAVDLCGRGVNTMLMMLGAAKPIFRLPYTFVPRPP